MRRWFLPLFPALATGILWAVTVNVWFGLSYIGFCLLMVTCLNRWLDGT